VVAPYLDQLRLVEELRDEVESNMGIILLNARIHGEGRKMIKIPPRLKKDLRTNFKPSYHVRFLGNRKNALVFHMRGEEEQPWVLAIQRNALTGVATKELIRGTAPPTMDEIEEAFAEYDKRDATAQDKFLDMVDSENR